VDYAVKKNNFGDILNPIVIEHFTKRKTTRIASLYYEKPHLLGIGSVLNRATKYSNVWGSGFIKEQSFVVAPPNKILAVRGPKTRKRLLELNINCPEVFGDPALLMPEIYYPKIKKKYKLGIIPHYVDFNDKRLKLIKDDNVIIIDICNPNPLLVIDQLLECETIASSSLHGLIVSDAYGIPNVWVKFSDNVVGGNFKFHDYFQSISRATTQPYIINDEVNTVELFALSQKNVLNIDLNILVNTLKNEYRIT
jgi:pyruvyltransferase